jgi:hypothetical protein
VNTFGFIGYGVAFAGFAGLSMLLAFALRGRGDAARRLPTRLLVALGATSLWALVLALDYSEIPVPSRLVLAAELLRAGAWVYALLGLAPATLPRFLIPTS